MLTLSMSSFITDLHDAFTDTIAAVQRHAKNTNPKATEAMQTMHVSSHFHCKSVILQKS